MCYRIESMGRYIAKSLVRPWVSTLPDKLEFVDVDLEPVTNEGRDVYGISGCLSNRRKDIARLQEPIHIVFANWPPDDQGILSFVKKYGVLESMEAPYSLSGSEIFVDLWDWRETQIWFQTLWEVQLGKLPKKRSKIKGWSKVQDDIEQRRTERLRNIRKIYPDLAEKIQSERNEKKTGIGQINRMFRTESDDGHVKHVPAVQALLDVKGRWGMEIVCPDLLRYLVILLLCEKPSSPRLCAREGCPAPYYVARREDQKYCGKDCSQYIATKNWWGKNGNEWRRRKKMEANVA